MSQNPHDHSVEGNNLMDTVTTEEKCVLAACLVSFKHPQHTTRSRLRSEVWHWRHFLAVWLESAYVDWETSQELQWKTGGMTSTLRVELYVQSAIRLLLTASHLRHLCIVLEVHVCMCEYCPVLCTTGRSTVMRVRVEGPP